MSRMKHTSPEERYMMCICQSITYLGAILSVSALLVSWKVRVISGAMPASPAMKDSTVKGMLLACHKEVDRDACSLYSILCVLMIEIWESLQMCVCVCVYTLLSHSEVS